MGITEVVVTLTSAIFVAALSPAYWRIMSPIKAEVTHLSYWDRSCTNIIGGIPCYSATLTLTNLRGVPVEINTMILTIGNESPLEWRGNEGIKLEWPDTPKSLEAQKTKSETFNFAIRPEQRIVAGAFILRIVPTIGRTYTIKGRFPV